MAAAFTEWTRMKQRMVLVSLAAPTGVAPAGVIWLQVADLTPPAP